VLIGGRASVVWKRQCADSGRWQANPTALPRAAAERRPQLQGLLTNAQSSVWQAKCTCDECGHREWQLPSRLENIDTQLLSHSH
jgi:hypothetical protein